MKNFLMLIVLALVLQVSAFGQAVIKGSVTLTAVAVDPPTTTTNTGTPTNAVITTTLGCGVGFVQFYSGTTALGPAITTPATGNSYVFVWDTKTVPNGVYSISAKASDKAGLPDGHGQGTCDSTKPNVGTSAPLVVVVNNVPPDAAVPTISITIN